MLTFTRKKSIALLLFLLQLIENFNGASSIFCLYYTKPKQIRLALRPTGMTVSWTTDGYFNQNDTPKPQVSFGTNPSSLIQTSSNSLTTTYHPLPIFKRYFHNVYLDGLQPSTNYYFRITASNRCARESDIGSFRTAPLPETVTQYPVNISIVGDLGLNNYFNTYQAEKTIATMQKYISKTNAFMHIGDISYADLYGLAVNFDFYENTWNRFQDAIEPIASRVPYHVLPGNHEATCFQYDDTICPSYLKNFTAYLNRFHMSGELSGGYKNMWYSFDYGPVHIVMLNTETDFVDAPSGPGTVRNAGHFFGTTGQTAWLQRDLENATKPERRQKVPWIIVAGHRPLFGSTVKPQGVIAGEVVTPPSSKCDSCRMAFWSILSQYKVDFYLAGHLHWMELLYPLNTNGTVVAKNFNNVDGIIHLTTGAGGAPSGFETIETVDQERQAYFVSGYGFNQLLIKNSSHAILNFINSTSETVVYSVDIIRKH